MTTRHRTNPLALAVLISLHERPMHPYEVSTILRERNKHESVRLNFGSLYAVVASLEKRGLIVPQETLRDGRLPERTVYRITDRGRLEAHEWLTTLISTPVNDFPAFGAGLSFLPALPPREVAPLLRQRAGLLEQELAKARDAREVNERSRVPRLIWVEDEFRAALLEAELTYVRSLVSEIEAGSLEGIDWWRAIHEPDESIGWKHDLFATREPVQ
jgi:DNA-binding PadR family transcriptional regulator